MSQNQLDDFEGIEVVGATISVRKAGDGLSTALAVDPSPYHKGDRVYVVLETSCAAITYKASKEKGQEDLLVREHVLDTQHAAIVSGASVAKMLKEAKKEQAEHAAKVAEQKAADKGTIKIDGTNLDDVEPSDADHAGRLSE